MAIACRPEEQKRFTVVAATVTGSPARIADTRFGSVPAARPALPALATFIFRAGFADFVLARAGFFFAVVFFFVLRAMGAKTITWRKERRAIGEKLSRDD